MLNTTRKQSERAKRIRWKFPFFGAAAPAGPARPSCTAGEVVQLDVSGRDFEAQSMLTLREAGRLTPGQRLRHTSGLVHWPMLAMLDARGLLYRIESSTPGDVRILIWPRQPGVCDRGRLLPPRSRPGRRP